MAMLNNQRVTIVISTISHSYWSYLHQLSDSELGHHLAFNQAIFGRCLGLLWLRCLCWQRSSWRLVEPVEKRGHIGI